MRKLLIQILILTVTLLSVNLFAQNDSKVDIRAMVKAQMLKAQGNIPMVEKKSAKGKSERVSFPNISSGVFRVLIFILSSIIILSLVYLRRVRIQHQLVSKRFKENIRLIREESLRPPIDYSLTPVRKSLLEKIGTSLEEKTITSLAKKLNIAKGEILLVNSMKNYAAESSIARNKA